VSFRSKIKALVGLNPFAWLGYARHMRRLITEHLAALPAPTRGEMPMRAMFVIGPWAAAPNPWFSLVCALLVARRGVEIMVIIEDTPFGPRRAEFAFTLALIKWALAPIAARHPVRLLSSFTAAGDAATQAAVTKSSAELASLNATWYLRGEMRVQGRDAMVARFTHQIASASSHMGPALSEIRPDFLFVPGGIFATSGAWNAAARAADVRLVTYDAGTSGVMIWAMDGVACHLDDIPRAFAALSAEASDACARADMIAIANAEVALRKSGTDRFDSQATGSGTDGRPSFGPCIVIALNSSWDAAALGRYRLFADSLEWIAETVDYLLRDTDATVVVRQHPAERLDFARTSDDYRAFLASRFGAHERLIFIAAADPVNSYDLMREALAFVVHTSTVGIEATMEGKPVITASTSYYSDLGFIWSAASLGEYRDLLGAAASGRLVPDQARIDDATIAYYATQCRNWLVTPFNPADFKRWYRLPLDGIERVPGVDRMMDGILTDIPIALVNHRAECVRKGQQEPMRATI
jgi:Capsule polysaccharide biosynthesis protein